MRLEDAFLNSLLSEDRTDLTAMATEMAGGTEPPGATPMTLKEFATSAADVPAGLLKGAIQGSAGLPGDIISLMRGLYDLGASGGDFNAFLSGLKKATGMPTTEDVKKFFDETLGMPLVPAGASERRRQAAKTPEFVGELFGGGKTAIETAKAAGRGARAISREIATTPPTGAVQVAPTPVQAPRSKIGFYSAVEETVANIPQAKGTGQQYLAQIQKSAGVKPEELKWTGLDEFLKGKKSVTKQEIQDYLNANRVDVQEVRLGTPQALEARNQQIAQKYGYQAEFDNGEIAFFDPRLNDYVEFRDLPIEMRTEISNPQMQFGGTTNFSSYTLPGGENYREILLTMPFKEPKMPKGYEVSSMQYDDGTVRYFAETPTTRSAGYKTEAEAQSELQRMTEGLKDWRASQASYRSSHFDQPNILAHMRVNDRVVDGKKTLFIEEIQSDWHQAGRKKGYGPQTETTHEAYYTTPDGQRVSLGFGKTQEEAAAAVDPGWQGIVDVKFDTQTKKVGEGVPDAPFKTSWHELTLKRAIQEASEKGYDQIAFTTGKTQAERYDLSKQIDEINVVGRTDALTGEKSKSIALDTVDGQSIRLGVSPDGTVDNVNNRNMTNLIGKNLDEVVGKELAKKIMEGGSQTISGEGLKVGGEGMAGFYDQILPKSLEKLGKKFNAKVTKSRLPSTQNKDDLTEKVYGRGELYYRLPSELKSKIDQMYLEDGIEVWTMDITPKMRESVVSKGQPLFVAPVVAPGMMQEKEAQ